MKSNKDSDNVEMKWYSTLGSELCVGLPVSVEPLSPEGFLNRHVLIDNT